MKKVLIVLMVLAMTLGTALGVPAEEKATLTVLIYVGTEIQESIKALSAPFEEAHNCTVDIILCPLDSYDQKMSTMIASGAAPDVYWVAEYATPQYYEDGLMLDLSELMADEEWDFSDFTIGQQHHYLYDGKLIGVPFSGCPLVLFYNKTIFEEAGHKTPTEMYEAGEWTVEAMLETAKALANPDKGIYGIDFSRGGDWANWDVCMTPVLRLFGGSAWSDDYTTVQIDSEASVKGVQAFYDLMFTDKVHPMPGTTIDFNGGQLAMFPNLFNNVKKLVDVNFEWDVVPMPLNGNGESSGWMGSAGYAVYPYGDKTELAKEYVRFITSKELISSMMFTFVPTRTSVITSEAYRTGNYGEFLAPSEKSFDYCINESLDAVRVKQPHPNYNDLTQVITEYLELIYAGAMQPADALQTMAAEMQPFMLSK